MFKRLTIKTSRRSEMVNITNQVREAVAASGVKEGMCIIYVPHTTAGVTINEQADPTVVADLLQHLDEMVPWDADYRHREGNAAAHIKASLVGSSQTVLIGGGTPLLGTWQGIFFCEFDGPRRREVYLCIQPVNDAGGIDREIDEEMICQIHN